MLNSLDLFSGIGGISLALQDYVRPIAYCEIDQYCRQVLTARMNDKRLTRAPMFNDVKELQTEGLDFDIITAGFPCQDISVAGNGKGLEGERSGLFFEIIRLVKEANPTWVFLENVPAIRTKGLTKVIESFSNLGYDCRWTCVSAREVGAPHLRKRWFMLAHNRGEHVERLEQQEYTRETYAQAPNSSYQYSWQVALNKFPRMDDGLPVPVDHIRGLGNAVVPAQCKLAFERLAES